MGSAFVGGLLAFLGGCAVAFINDGINRRALRKKPEAIASLSTVRQALNVAYFVVIYLLRNVLPWGFVPLLVGAALGLTIPSVVLSMRLAKQIETPPASAEAEKGEMPDE